MRGNVRLPSPEHVRRLLDYQPDTGFLFWRRRDESEFADSKKMISASHRAALWNGRYAGKRAFTCLDGGYLNGALCGVGAKAHRVAWCHFYGEWPKRSIDHINGDGEDNRICNLRDVDHEANMQNVKLRADNKSGYQGVSWVERDNLWHARIGNVSIGYYKEKSAAIAARAAAAREHGYHPNHGRR